MGLRGDLKKGLRDSGVKEVKGIKGLRKKKRLERLGFFGAKEE
jgi:hypothetical protein